MSPALVEKIKVLVEFGFNKKDEVQVNGAKVAPRDLMMAMMDSYVPPITSFLEPPANQPPDWTKEVVTEIKGTKDGKIITYRIGTLTVKGPLPTGVVPARGVVWQAQGRTPTGVIPPEVAFEPESFLKELEDRDIYTQVTVTQGL
jgi:saccharopine dehydrogenase-like NADP-dependent oxidoreductase